MRGAELPLRAAGFGHAHGKVWAQVASYELKRIDSTETDEGARLTLSYGMSPPIKQSSQ